MTSITQQRVRGRPARKLQQHPLITSRLTGRREDTPGPTSLSYTPDGKRLVTAGSNNAIRVYTTGSTGEPVTIDNCQESNTAVVAGVRPLFLLHRVQQEDDI